MEVTLFQLYAWVLTANPFNALQVRVGLLVAAAQLHMHTHTYKYEEMRKAHNSVKVDVNSSEWDDTCCVTYA